MSGKPDYHKLCKAHLRGLCQTFRLREVPRLYTAKWPAHFGKKTLGVYDHHTNSIYLNLAAHKGSIAEMYDTIGHELAHHVTRHKSAHGREWRKAAKRFGATTP